MSITASKILIVVESKLKPLLTKYDNDDDNRHYSSGKNNNMDDCKGSMIVMPIQQLLLSQMKIMIVEKE